jgi:hypothetical protein
MYRYTYQHRTTGEVREIETTSLNRAREQFNKAEWRLVSCHDARGLCWTAEAVGLEF